MANMTFKANLLPNSDLGYSLGSSEQKWKINGSSLGTAAFKNESGTWAISISGSSASCTGNAATATKISSTPNNTSTFLRGDNTWSNTLVGPLRLGGPDTATNTGYATDNVGSNNYIAFYGVYNDAPGGYNHCYIGERIYGAKGTAQEQSELLLFKGNDIGTANPGPDRIRLLAAETDIQCYTTALSGSFMAVGEAGGTQVCKFRPDGITSAVNITAPTFIGNLSGTATKVNQDGSGNTITSKYVTLDTEQVITGTKYWGSGGAGGQLNGAATDGGINSIRVGNDVWLGDCNTGGIMGMKSTGSNCGFYFYNSSGTKIGHLYCESSSRLRTDKTICVNDNSNYAQFRAVCGNYGALLRNDGSDTYILLTNSGNQYGQWNDLRPLRINNSSGYTYFTRGYGAVWNDYAEFRQSDELEPGRCIVENGDGSLSRSTERLQRGCEIVSDTYGFAIGETEECKCPTACAGRVLAYPYEAREEFRKYIGYCVCSGPNGTVSIMTEEEEMKYPGRIIGTISEVPEYNKWKVENKE